MKKQMRRIATCMMLVIVAMSVMACGKPAGELTSEAAKREQGIPKDGKVYIDDEAIALAKDITSADQDQSANFASAAQQAFAEVNTIRVNAGLSALTWSDPLLPPTNVRAQEASQSFSHIRPDGSEWWTVDSQLMYGENLAKGYSDAHSAVQAWMNSPTHKANIMNGDFKSMAIAITQGSDGAWYWAQEFGY
ncbi:MAG: CAP domain-containing protein [Lachnospiraceae bacterium]|nr:CAP domain-containing protein [Lachnospiraceae bacterium]